jgi:hypothetical protein
MRTSRDGIWQVSAGLHPIKNHERMLTRLGRMGDVAVIA